MENKEKKSAYYEVYTKAFKDSNGDGIGDIKGLRSKLSMINQIGFNYLLITDLFTEKTKDFTKIKDFLGQSDDIKDLSKKAKEFRIKIILDFEAQNLYENLDNFPTDFINIIKYWKDRGIKGIRIKKADLLFEKNQDKNLRKIKEFCQSKDLLFILGLENKDYGKDITEFIYIENINSYIKRNNYKDFYEKINSLQEDMENEDINYGLNFTNLSYPRLVDKVLGEDEESVSLIKAFYIMLFSLKTIPFVFQGEEIQAKSEYNINIEEINDDDIKTIYKDLKNEGLSEDDAVRKIKKTTNFSTKTPLRWDDSSLGGFSDTKNYYGVLVNKNNSFKQELKDIDSFLYYLNDLIMKRKINSAYGLGSYEKISIDESAYIYKRSYKDGEYIVLVNLSDDFYLVDEDIAQMIEGGEVLINNKRDFEPEVLDIYQALVIKLKR